MLYSKYFTKYPLEKFILEKIIDLSYEVAEYPRSVDKRRTWLATDLTAEDWTIPLGQSEHDEICSMIKNIRENPAPSICPENQG
jgi:capsule polysaccharide export protein KpsC/LpsZ